jgi:hypothetical protein
MHFYIGTRKYRRNGICIREYAFYILRDGADKLPEIVSGGAAVCLGCGHDLAVCPINLCRDPRWCCPAGVGAGTIGSGGECGGLDTHGGSQQAHPGTEGSSGRSSGFRVPCTGPIPPRTSRLFTGSWRTARILSVKRRKGPSRGCGRKRPMPMG